MKDVTQIIKAGQKASWKDSKESARPADGDKVEIEYLFGVLAIEYPFFIPKADSDLIMKRNMWISLLKNYDRKQRMEAVKKCLRHHTSKGGPTIGQFLELLKVNMAHKDVKRLPPPPVNEEKQAVEMKKIRELLRVR